MMKDSYTAKGEFIVKILYTLFNLYRKLFVRRGRILYINGVDSLPRTLSPEEEADVLARLERESELRGYLVEHNLRLVVYIAKKFENTGVATEDLISIGTIGLIKSINTFKPDKNIKLATYASRCIENEILMYLRKTSGRRETSLDEPLSIDWDGNELLLSDILSDETYSTSSLEKEEDRKTVKNALAKLGKRERMIIELRFGLIDGEERTQKDVATMLGISQSYISRLEKKILHRLRCEIKDKI